MKHYLAIVLAFACIVLVIFLVVMKRGNDAQHETDAGALTDYSNRLDTAQTEIAIGKGTILTLSNRLDECQSAALTFSNRLIGSESTIASDKEQIAGLNQQVAGMESEKQTLSRHVTDLAGEMTNQMTALTRQITLTQASLDQTNEDLAQAQKDYVLLENRFRIDVAERVVVERKFNNPPELKAQMQNLKENPATVVSAERIYAGLDVEVKSNTFHVISPN